MSDIKLKFKDLNNLVSRNGSSSATITRVEMNRMMSKIGEVKRMIKKNDTTLQRTTAKDIMLSSGLNSRQNGKESADKITSITLINTIIAL